MKALCCLVLLVGPLVGSVRADTATDDHLARLDKQVQELYKERQELTKETVELKLKVKALEDAHARLTIFAKDISEAQDKMHEVIKIICDQVDDLAKKIAK
jgi:septal ring factor EnvC (AmiA/AmiB activator)